MKKIAWWIFAVLLGEFLVLVHKDKKFKTTVKKKKGWEKVKYICNSLFQLNKDLVDRAQQEIQDLDIQENIAVWKEKAEEEYDILVKKISDIENKIASYTEKDIAIIVKELKTTYTQLLSKVKKIAEELDEKYDLEKKVVAIKKQITTLQNTKKSS